MYENANQIFQLFCRKIRLSRNEALETRIDKLTKDLDTLEDDMGNLVNDSRINRRN
jgi:hypothetical protein